MPIVVGGAFSFDCDPDSLESRDFQTLTEEFELLVDNIRSCMAGKVAPKLEYWHRDGDFGPEVADLYELMSFDELAGPLVVRVRVPSEDIDSEVEDSLSRLSLTLEDRRDFCYRWVIVDRRSGSVVVFDLDRGGLYAKCGEENFNSSLQLAQVVIEDSMARVNGVFS